MLKSLLLATLVMGWSVAAATPPRIAIIIDDLGYQADLDRRTLALPTAVAVAIIPDAPLAPRLAREADAQAREILLHMPLAGLRDCLDVHCIQPHWDSERMRMQLERGLGRVPGASGMNNHMGSVFTANGAASDSLMQALAAINRYRGQPLYFVDSRTTPRSRAAEAARQHEIPYASRDVFLDHDASPEAVAAAWKQLLATARQRGHAIAIGHPRDATLALLETELPVIEAAGVKLVPVSDLIRESPIWQPPSSPLLRAAKNSKPSL